MLFSLSSLFCSSLRNRSRRRRPAGAPPFDPWILLHPVTSSSSSQCWCFFYPCNIPGTSPDPLYTSSYFVSLYRSVLDRVSLRSSLRASRVPWHRGDECCRGYAAIEENPYDPVYSGKRCCSTLWRILPGY